MIAIIFDQLTEYLAKANLLLLKDKSLRHSRISCLFVRYWLMKKGVSWRGNLYLNAIPYIPFKGTLVLGRNCSFGEDTSFYLHERVTIGDNFLGAPGIAFVTGDHEVNNLNYVGSEIKVGKNVWFGFGVVVLAGADINDNVRIGARSVVTKGVYPTGVYVGVPARLNNRSAR